MFIVECYATLHPALSVRWSVDPSLGLLDSRSIGPFYIFSAFLSFSSLPLLPNILVTFSSTAHADPHATGVAIYPALLMNALPIN